MALAFFKHVLIGIRGGGDLASGVVYRLHRAGFPVIITELESPLFVRRTVSYGEAVYSESITVDGVVAHRVNAADDAQQMLDDEIVPVMVDPNGENMHMMRPLVVVDGRVAKKNLGVTINDAPLVIALGPGFSAGVDCHVVIETNRGHKLGRVIHDGCADPNTGVPGNIQSRSHARVLRAPCDGHVQPVARIGDLLTSGQLVAQIDDIEIRSPFDGVLRGLIHERVQVTNGMKIGDVDPRGIREHCFTISDKSLAVAGGVLEAVMGAPQIRPYLANSAYETSHGI